MTTDLDAAFTFELSTSARKMRKLFDAFVRERGLTLARARALLLLSRSQAWNQKELAEALDIEHPSVVRLLDGLERQGLIIRSTVKNDRRAKRIELTPAAKQQVAELEEISTAVRKLLLRDIETDDLRNALKVLRQITENAGNLPAAGRMEDLDAAIR